MDQSVIIKGFNHGICVVLDPKVEYTTLKERLATKFRDSSKFLGSAQVALRFEGRKLTADQQRELLDIITDECSLTIACVVEDDPEMDQLMLAALQKVSAPVVTEASHNAQFHKGNLRSGAELIFDSNVVIIGDVNPGASVLATGSIIVLGSLKGTAFAGTDGNDKAFVLALDMAPVQIRIADTIARSPDRPARSENKESQIAFLEDGAIYIEPVNKKVLSERKL